MSERCRFCCMPLPQTTRRAQDTLPPINEIKTTPIVDRYAEIFTKYPVKFKENIIVRVSESNAIPTVFRKGEVYEICRWNCKNLRNSECCSCCRPSNTLLPWELTEEEKKQMVDGAMFVAE